MTKDHFVSRRALLALLAGAFSSRGIAAQSQDPVFSALDHIEIYVSSSEKTRDFHVRLFGAGMKTRLARGINDSVVPPLPSRRRLPIPRSANGSLFSFDQGIADGTAPRLSESAWCRLPPDYPSGRDTAVIDPDDIRMQIIPEDGWSLLTEPNFRSETLAVVEPPLFRPTRLDHILLNVTDVERSSGFYQKVLGAQRNSAAACCGSNSASAQLGLIKVPPGQQKGINRIGLLTSPFESADMVNRLRADEH